MPQSDLKLPADGSLRLGHLELPEGERVHVVWPGREPYPVAWVTSKEVPEPGALWSDLSGMSLDTGLIPFVATAKLGHQRRPWNRWNLDFEFPDDLAEIDAVDAEAFLGKQWELERGWENAEELDEEDRLYLESRTDPFGHRFPGLAPAIDEGLTDEQIDQHLRSLPSARIGLAVASRPADALVTMGWGASDKFPGGVPMAAVARSWEDRFCARLLTVSTSEFSILVQRPPRTQDMAERIAAELCVFCDEFTCAGQTGLNKVSDIAAQIVKSPIWGFWWD